MTEREDALRRALQEVAASTAAAAKEPPPVGDAEVVPLAPRRRTERWVLGGVAAAVVLVAAVLAGVLVGGDDGSDESLEVADDTTTSSESSTTSTSAPPLTTDTTATTQSSIPGPTVTTAVGPAPPAGELLAAGDGWEVRLAEGCVVVLDGDGRAGEECDRDVDAWLLAAPLGDGRTVHVAGGRRVVTADAYAADGISMGEPPMVGDFASGLFLVTDTLPPVVLLREGQGANWTAGVYGGELITDDAAFGDQLFAYQRATGSLSFGRYMEFGGYYSPGDRCAVARQVTPGPALLAQSCLTGGADVAAVLIPTEQPGFYDIVGIATDLNEWRCVLPGGGSCGSNEIVGIAGFAGIIAQQGPLVIDDATEVVIETDRGSVTIPVPR